MPTLTFAERRALVCRQVANVIDGFTADATQRLSRPISFTKDPGARREVGLLVADMGALLLFDIRCPDPTRFIIRLLSHLTKIGTQTAQAIHRFHQDQAPELIEAFRASPQHLGSAVSFPAILRQHRQAIAQADAELARRYAIAPPRPELYANPPYHLTELTHPLHLIDESDQLYHCIGLQMAVDAPAILKLPSRHPRRLAQLAYWQQLQSGRRRLFSFGEGGHAMVTILFDTGICAITAMRGFRNRPAFALPKHRREALERALDALTTVVGPFTVQQTRLRAQLPRHVPGGPEPQDPPLSIEQTLERIREILEAEHRTQGTIANFTRAEQLWIAYRRHARLMGDFPVAPPPSPSRATS